MKRFLPSLIFAAVVLVVCAHIAQSVTTVQTLSAIVSSAGCTGIGTNQYGNAQICFDSGNSMTEYIRDANGNWTQSASGTFNPAVPGPIGGTTPSTGAFTVLTATSAPSLGAIGGTTPAAGTFTVLNATSAPALGAIGGTTPAAITGTVIVGTTSVNASATGDEALNATNGGHISSLLGTGTLPTVGTGTITAGGTDSAMEVTGATSPATVTFHTAFHAKPICVCGDETAAVGACEVVANSNGQTAVVTTTGTDSFTLICIGK